MHANTRFGCLIALGAAMLLGPLVGQSKEADAPKSSTLSIHVTVPRNTPPSAAVDMLGARSGAYRNDPRQLTRDPDGHFTITLYRVTPGEELSSNIDYPITFQMVSPLGTFRAPSVYRTIRMPAGDGVQSVDFEIKEWAGFGRQIAQIAALILSLALAVLVGGIYGMRRYRRRTALPAPATGSVVAEHDTRSAELSATVKALTTEAREMERWSRAFQR